MPPRIRLLNVPLLPIAITLAVLISGGFAVQPIRDAASLADPAESFLVKPFWYVAIAPVSAVLDTLTLMSVKQHYFFVSMLLLAFGGYRAGRHAVGKATWRTHVVSATVFLISLLAVYAAAAALPRPMAYLAAHDVNVVRIDFHSHTSASHDGRAGFTPERNRSWHEGAGYDVGYVADHATVAGAEQAMAANPNPAANGVTLLQSMEASWNGEHVGILGAQRAYRGVTTENLRDIDEQSLALASMVTGREPIVVWHHPRRLNRLPIAREPGASGVRAIEIVNGSPRDADEVRPQRAAIIQLSDRSGVALVSGSDNHGWGHAAPAWTLMIILNWRAMNADVLAREIERGLREGGATSTHVIERRVADPGADQMALAATVFTVPARMLTTLSTDERLAWLFWTWLLWAGAALRRRRRERTAA